MKKTAVILILILFAVVLHIFFIPTKMRVYYANRDNFIETNGVLTHMKVNEETGDLYLAFEHMDVSYSDDDFKIICENYRIAKENGIEKKLHLGTKVTFVSAPRYFNDGYVMPIVAISIDGNEFLTFEDGYRNFQKWYRNWRNLI